MAAIEQYAAPEAEIDTQLNALKKLPAFPQLNNENDGATLRDLWSVRLLLVLQALAAHRRVHSRKTSSLLRAIFCPFFVFGLFSRVKNGAKPW
ncbi:MAG: hypothetical protein ACPGSC_13450 [Granulosicoccaceae bacterium]